MEWIKIEDQLPIIEFKIYCKECGTHICEGMIYKTVEGGYICEFCIDGEID